MSDEIETRPRPLEVKKNLLFARFLSYFVTETRVVGAEVDSLHTLQKTLDNRFLLPHILLLATPFLLFLPSPPRLRPIYQFHFRSHRNVGFVPVFKLASRTLLNETVNPQKIIQRVETCSSPCLVAINVIT